MREQNYKLMYMRLKEDIYREAVRLHELTNGAISYESAMRYAFAEDVLNDLYVDASMFEEVGHV